MTTTQALRELLEKAKSDLSISALLERDTAFVNALPALLDVADAAKALECEIPLTLECEDLNHGAPDVQHGATCPPKVRLYDAVESLMEALAALETDQ